MVKLFQTPGNPEDRQQILLDAIERYCAANFSYIEGDANEAISPAKFFSRWLDVTKILRSIKLGHRLAVDE